MRNCFQIPSSRPMGVLHSSFRRDPNKAGSTNKENSTRNLRSSVDMGLFSKIRGPFWELKIRGPFWELLYCGILVYWSLFRGSTFSGKPHVCQLQAQELDLGGLESSASVVHTHVGSSQMSRKPMKETVARGCYWVAGLLVPCSCWSFFGEFQAAPVVSRVPGAETVLKLSRAQRPGTMEDGAALT